MGKVYLIGAGSGDEELLTLKAVRVLKNCTAIMYDRLLGGNILKYTNENSKIFYCGKEPGCHYKTQDEINKMLISLAKEGHTVGRIKGGDPYVFGRGGEEALELRKENIDFEVVPGVTSAIAALNYAGIPVTNRGMSQSFHVITGMSSSTLKIDWKSISKVEGTLVFLMGLNNISNIIENLIKHGKNPNTPSAVIMRGTTSHQRKVVGKLKDIALKATEAKLKSPSIIVIGKVVNLNTQLNWYETLPLFGLNVCVTRSKSQAENLSKSLKNLGAEVTEINSIKIESNTKLFNNYITALKEYKFIVFTSVNSVNIFFDHIKNKNYDIRNIKGDFAVIGDATENALNNRGVIAKIKAKEFTGKSLLESLIEVVKPNDSILIPCSKKAKSTIKDGLEKMHCNVDMVPIYDVIKGTIKNKNAFNDVDVVIFTSPTTVKNMIELVGIQSLKNKICLSIGPITYKELTKHNIDAYISEKHCNLGIVNKLMDLRKENLL